MVTCVIFIHVHVILSTFSKDDEDWFNQFTMIEIWQKIIMVQAKAQFYNFISNINLMTSSYNRLSKFIRLHWGSLFGNEIQF